MGEDETKLQSLQEDSQIRHKNFVLLAENAAGFQKRVEEILEEIEQNGNFSEMTAEVYDQKKSYLTRHLTELLRIHRVLADQNAALIGKLDRNCLSQIKNQYLGSFDFVLSPGVRGFYISNGSECFMSTNKLLISSVKDDTLKVKETKADECLLEMSFNLEEELVSLNKKVQSLEDENRKLKQEIEENESDIKTQNAHLETEKVKVIELQKKLADLNLVISDSNLKIKTMGEKLEASKKKLTVSNNVIADLKHQRSSQDSLEKQRLQVIRSDQNLLDMLNKKIVSQTQDMHGFQEKLSLRAAEISKRDDQITELKKMNKQYTFEISQMKSIHKMKENNWRAGSGKLRKELEEKGESVDDLNKKLDTLQAEKCSQDNLFQELVTQLDLLQADHLGVLASFDNAQEVKKELTMKVAELEKEVDEQREVISDRAEEKREAIRQLSSSLEHYKSRYEELRNVFVSNNTACCFDFLR